MAGRHPGVRSPAWCRLVSWLRPLTRRRRAFPEPATTTFRDQENPQTPPGGRRRGNRRRRRFSRVKFSCKAERWKTCGEYSRQCLSPCFRFHRHPGGTERPAFACKTVEHKKAQPLASSAMAGVGRHIWTQRKQRHKPFPEILKPLSRSGQAGAMRSNPGCRSREAGRPAVGHGVGPMRRRMAPVRPRRNVRTSGGR